MDSNLIGAVAEVLKEERAITDRQIENILEKLGDERLLPRIAIARLEQQKAAVSNYVDALLLKKSKVVSKSGAVPYHLKALDQ